MLSYIKRFFEERDCLRSIEELHVILAEIAKLREQQLQKGEQHVIFYASGCLHGSHEDQISNEDIDGFMQACREVEGKSLTLILHTPGGDPSAVETVVEYLHSKYDYIEVIVPVFAMSGGAAISLGSDHIMMNKAGQIGPFDMQFGMLSARSIKESLDKVRDEVRNNTGMADLWERIDPLLVVEAEKGLSYTKQMVSNWLTSRSLLKDKQKVEKITAYFNAESDSGYGQIHLHAQRIGIAKLREMGLNVTALEDSQELHDAVMDAYWSMVEFFRSEEMGSIERFMASSNEAFWVKFPEQQYLQE